ncbi:DUF2889 domain-containing protein [Noviherbaspirillum pedocola]|uniref:DUF2889 domain-containing protein n=1 Tax=Noviherbaspirillum pedocola TaxID=2801341 RepID=A0A934W6X2_9BURK|nr:DUF2889 domain-containing protein [Noviherbaspirillum pedocola]MBK4734893.1 DUF2889 domain-containing protein [Noviherbaspirillum pedocola]
MPLPNSPVRREKKHTRAIRIDAYAREDGLWDIDANISDVKTRDVHAAAGVRVAGEPIHDLWLRLTIDTSMQIVDVAAVSDSTPYPGHCDTIGPDYRKLIGLNLMQGFRYEVKQRMGGIAGCTHLSELATILPTAAVQAFAGDVIPVRGEAGADGQAIKPFQLDRCHALRTDGAAVAQFYPRWATARPTKSTT